ncbi:ATP-binding protein [Bacillus sp. CECT 9360]|uniref:ATP-binding protein n=1 Tax=Bacillus sp. CECT 9360 TaxID=2845821 RepID=UPI001E53E2B9|nr:ATP-binding protein [Bacillus sp. CECT 9360]CAH0346420.1 hypothetical protein BCI9360_02754 [Bacillus sp. CECT 9360]
MRRLIDKVLRDPSKEQSQLIPSLPSDITYTDLKFRTKRGFLARKLCQYVDLGKVDKDLVFYDSFSKSSFSYLDQANTNELVLHLSERMLKWTEEKQDIPNQIKRLDVRADIQNSMLKAYEIYKDDLFLNTDTPKINANSETKNYHDKGKWEVYRDVIMAASQGKFLLIDENEAQRYKEGIILCEGTIKERSDIPVCRNLAKESLESKNYGPPNLMSWLLVLSEAITNTIKHAEEGKMTIIEDETSNEIRFIIEDKGPGFPLDDLPKKTLLAGYSTKKSMGQGFTLMMKMTKQISLFSSSTGSIIILSFERTKEKEGNLYAVQ